VKTKILSLDYGRKNIGISISDTTKSIAFIRESIKNDQKAKQKLENLIQDENISQIVIGKNQNINPNFDLNTEAKEFLKKINLKNITITTVNEDFSTFEAINKLKKSGLKEEEILKLKDSASAQVILEKFLQTIEE
jgi:putative Holliday junction resolvase